MCEVLTAEDVKEIIEAAHHNEDIRLLDYTICYRQKHGYLGDHFTLTARIEFNGRQVENSFFIKTYKVPAANELDFLGETGIFRKEVEFYREVFQKLRAIHNGPEWCPRYYFSKHRALVLEDLTKEKFELKTGDYLLDEDHLFIVLKILASFHANSLTFEQKESHGLDKAYPSCFKEILYEKENTNSPTYAWKTRQVHDMLAAVDYLNKYTPEQKQTIKKYLPRVIDEIYPLSKKSEKYQNVMVHGDMWSNNILFRYENGKPVDCRLVDFQFSRFAPPMHDIMHLLHLTSDHKFREHKEYDLIRTYYKYFGEYLALNNLDVNQFYTWDEFLESRDEYRLLAIIQSLLSIHYLLGGRKIQDNPILQKWEKSKVDDYLGKIRSESLKMLFSDEIYANRVGGILYELIDEYILNESKRRNFSL